jgi:hypothetical protein
MWENVYINFGLPWQSTSFTILERWADETLDIGFLELKPFEVEVLRVDAASAYKLGKMETMAVRPTVNRFVLCGYPTVLHSKDQKQIMYTPACLGCEIVHPDKWPQSVRENGKTPDNHIAIAYGEKHGGKFYDPDGNPLPTVDPPGMSGCGIWYAEPSNDDSQTQGYCLVAIQHSYFRQDQLVVGTFAEPIIHAICRRYGFPLPH